MPVHPSLIVAVAIVLATLSACETAPPIQEMSDARQAITVARDAGAAEVAANEFGAAEQSLKHAELRLQERNYAQARDAALLAHHQAKAALVRTETASQAR